jgi:protein phosphatase
VADRLASADSELIAVTGRVTADMTDPASVAAATDWWTELTAAGGEGMVVKPAANLVRGRPAGGSGPSGSGVPPGSGVPSQEGRLIQPGLKVRGREYLRIIYGPDYAEPANLERLRTRALGHKRARWPCASTPSGWRRWRGLRMASRCGACTSACSPSWRWNRSLWTRDCNV